MAAITFSEADVARTAPQRDEAYNITLASGVMAGHTLFQQPLDGHYNLTSALASGTAGFRGVALQTGVASGTISMLKRGRLWGFDIAHMNFDAPVYLSDTPGFFDDTAGTLNIRVGTVVSVNEPGLPTKVIYVNAEYASTFDLG